MMTTPIFPKILATTALCLAAVGLSSCSCQQGCPLLEEALYVNDTSAWYAAEKDMTNFYHVTALPSVRESYLNDFRQSSDASSQEFGRKRESMIHEMDAAASFISNIAKLKRKHWHWPISKSTSRHWISITLLIPVSSMLIMDIQTSAIGMACTRAQ